MTWTNYGTVTASGTLGASVTTPTLSSAVTAGDTLVVMIGADNSFSYQASVNGSTIAANTIPSSPPATFPVWNFQSLTGGNSSATILMAKVITGSEANTTSVTVTGLADEATTTNVTLMAFSGVTNPAIDPGGTGDLLSAYGTQRGQSLYALAGPLSTAAANELVLMCATAPSSAVYGGVASIGTKAAGMPSGFTQATVIPSSPPYTFVAGYYVKPAAGSLAGYGWNLTAATANVVTMSIGGT